MHGKIPESATERFVRSLVFGRILPSRRWLRIIVGLLWFYEASGLRGLVQGSGVLKAFGKLGRIEPLAPSAEMPSFFTHYGSAFPAEGQRRYRVALLGGCIANIFFARLHEATVRVLVKNGCEVHVPENQTCCGALHVHSGEREQARALARKNIDALLPGDYDAIISNTAGCGSTLKEYHELLEHDPAYADEGAAVRRTHARRERIPRRGRADERRGGWRRRLRIRTPAICCMARRSVTRRANCWRRSRDWC